MDLIISFFDVGLLCHVMVGCGETRLLFRTLRKRRRTIRSDTEVLYGSAATGAARDLPNYNAENETGKQSCVDTYHENPPPPLKCQTSFIDYDLPLEHNNGAAVPLQTSASPTHQLQSSKFRDYSDHTHPYHHAFNGQQHSQKNHVGSPFHVNRCVEN